MLRAISAFLLFFFFAFVCCYGGLVLGYSCGPFSAGAGEVLYTFRAIILFLNLNRVRVSTSRVEFVEFLSDWRQSDPCLHFSHQWVMFPVGTLTVPHCTHLRIISIPRFCGHR